MIEKDKLVQRTTEYLMSLPNGSSLTMWEAVMEACPEKRETINDIDLVVLLYEVEKTIREKGIVLDFTAYNESDVGLPIHVDFIVRKKNESVR